jgi:hypothetical protein
LIGKAPLKNQQGMNEHGMIHFKWDTPQQRHLKAESYVEYFLCYMN